MNIERNESRAEQERGKFISQAAQADAFEYLQRVENPGKLDEDNLAERILKMEPVFVSPEQAKKMAAEYKQNAYDRHNLKSPEEAGLYDSIFNLTILRKPKNAKGWDKV